MITCPSCGQENPEGFRLCGMCGAPLAPEAVPAREIAEVIGRRLNVPVVSKPREEAADHFGWIGQFFAIDGPASSAETRTRLGWRPTPGNRR